MTDSLYLVNHSYLVYPQNLMKLKKSNTVSEVKLLGNKNHARGIEK